MPTLLQHLTALPHRDLRAIATRLAVRQRDQNRKEDWIAAAVHAWHDDTRRGHLLAALSPAATAAAHRLAHAGAMPAALFLAEYGPIRHAGPGRRWTPPPWEAPRTVSEELYYCGLLCPAAPGKLAHARRLALPEDLRACCATSQAQPARPLPAPYPPGDAAPLLHDAGQALLYLVQHAGLKLDHGRWLPHAHLADLNRRLLQPEPAPLPHSHKRTRWLRFLWFLLTAADLQAEGAPTPLGWTWLAEPPAQQLALLWYAWQAAAPELRRAFVQPAAALPPPWPGLLLDYLACQTQPFTATDLANALLGGEARYSSYFTAHLPDLTTLDGLIAAVLTTTLCDWGAVAPWADPAAGPGTDASPAAGRRYTLTATGAWLLSPPQSGLATPPLPLLDAATAGQLAILAPDRWQVAIPVAASPWLQGRLALFAVHHEFDRQANPPRHVYRLGEDTVAQAAAAGHGRPGLLEALAGLGIALTPEQQAQLCAWHGRGGEIQLTTLAVLRTATPQLLARLVQTPALAGHLGDLLSSTVAELTVPPAEATRRLRAAGFYPSTVGSATPDQQSKSGDVPELYSGAAQVGGTTPGQQTTIPQGPERRGPLSAIAIPQSLWLAGQLYALLGQQVTLPLPPPFAALQDLLAGLPPAQQAVLQSQWERLREDLLALLDGQTFAPPPEPSEPTRWRPTIEQAIAAGRSLAMTYFTAGRNMPTRRVVTPYWLEEHRGIPYLRADCHLAGKVLLFRLDRIMELGD